MKVQNFVECLSGLYLVISLNFHSQFDMVVRHHQPECHTK